MSYSDHILKKQKYFEKTLSSSAIYAIYLRHLDIQDMFAQYVWMQIPVFDISELGFGLLYSILPVDYKPFSIDFQYRPPTTSDALQGIWAKFEPVNFSKLYSWMTDFREYIIENFEEEYQPQLLIGIAGKAVYGITPYGTGIYDPIVAREFLRSTFMKLRQMKTADISYLTTLEQLVDYLQMIGVTDEHIWNRLISLFAAQTYSFTLGISLLGRARLSTIEGNMAVVPIVDARGNIRDLKFRTLDQIQMGLILGIVPLGYGLLLPRETSVYKLIDNRKNPPIIKVIVEKVKGILDRFILTTWAYTNYNKPEEMTDYHKSQRTNQYDMLQTQRSIIEDWVEQQIPPEEANPIKIRQYKNAVLQYICYKSKRHKWGYEGWEAMTEDEFKGWWKGYWKGQGLNDSVLETLWQRMVVWLKGIRQQKTELGQKVQQIRKRLALLS
jgi:hypothetical protein